MATTFLNMDGFSKFKNLYRDAPFESIVYGENGLFDYIALYWRKRSLNLYAKKFDGLLVNNNKIVN